MAPAMRLESVALAAKTPQSTTAMIGMTGPRGRRNAPGGVPSFRRRKGTERAVPKYVASRATAGLTGLPSGALIRLGGRWVDQFAYRCGSLRLIPPEGARKVDTFSVNEIGEPIVGEAQ